MFKAWHQRTAALYIYIHIYIHLCPVWTELRIISAGSLYFALLGEGCSPLSFFLSLLLSFSGSDSSFLVGMANLSLGSFSSYGGHGPSLDPFYMLEASLACRSRNRKLGSRCCEIGCATRRCDSSVTGRLAVECNRILLVAAETCRFTVKGRIDRSASIFLNKVQASMRHISLKYLSFNMLGVYAQ